MKQLLVCCLALAFASNAAAQEWVDIFNGKDLAGWEGSPHWSVKDGAITGTTTKETVLKTNTFLIWKGGSPDNFELKAKFRMDNHNSGIQYRSKHLENKKPNDDPAFNYIVSGYQADMDAGVHMGILYEERGRGTLAQCGEKVVIDAKGKKQVVGSLGDKKKLLENFKLKEWNEYHIVCVGNHLKQFVNDVQWVDVIDHHVEKRALEGIIALQLHAGPAMNVQFKEIRLKKLPSGGIVNP